MGFYEEMQEIATDILTEFNQATVNLLVDGVTTGPAYNPTRGGTVRYRMAGAAVRGVSKQFIDGKDIVSSDLQVVSSVKMFAPDGTIRRDIRPTLNDGIEINGKPFKIVADKSVPPPPSDNVVTIILVIRPGR